MKKLFIVVLIFLFKTYAISAYSDTIHVVTHNKETVVTDPFKGNKSYIRWGVFPSEKIPIRKIILHVKFACPDTMRCADWDYSDRISILRTGGVKGSLQNYEIGRMLTPYGGAFGKDWNFEWEVDVTDFSLLLRDSVEIEYNHSGFEPNEDRGWAITLDFEIIKGKPALEPISIQKIYDDNFAYGDSINTIDQKLGPVSFTANPKANFAKLRIIQTGHGMDNPDGCGEFCNKYREFWYDGKMIDSKPIWKKCGENPLYPQAGTWIFDRANWCPGYLMQPDWYDLDISNGSIHSINFNMQTYISANPSAIEVISAYLIQYKKPAELLDISIEDVMVPSSKSIYKRLNPSGANAQILVKNSGATEIKTITIEYGTNGFEKKKHVWSGNLASGKTVQINLPGNIDFKSGSNNFKVSISKPNGKKDGYVLDNTLTVPFTSTPIHDKELIFYLLTNNQPEQNSYSVKNSKGEIIQEQKLGSLKAKTEYRDTLKLTPGAYQLELTDIAGDGLEFWYNTEGGRGLARLMNNKGELLKSFESDCGSGWIYNFVVGPIPDEIKKDDYSIGLFPTRTTDKTTLDFFGNKANNVIVRLVSDPGGNTVEEHIYSDLKEGIFTYDLSRYPKGRFYLKVIINDTEVFNKRIRFIE